MVSNLSSIAFHDIFGERIKLNCCINWLIIKIAKIWFCYNFFSCFESIKWDNMLSLYLLLLVSPVKRCYPKPTLSWRHKLLSLLPTLQNTWNSCQNCQTLLTGMLESELQEENEIKNGWLSHFASLQFQTWAWYRETKNSLEHQNPVSRDLHLCQPLINRASLSWWKQQICLSKHWDGGNHTREALLLIPNLPLGSWGHPALFPASVQVKLCAKHTFPTNPRDSSSSYISKVSQRTIFGSILHQC